ncbi:hypothetical protein FBU30_002916 [Linnemannia zychae]|nr:hypothetical protein FBU30_002916 [Linnemannia zychae]
MNRDPNLRSSNQRSSNQQESKTSSQLQGQTTSEQRSETPSHAGQSNIEAPMSGKKMCNHTYDCDCSTQAAIHGSEEHAPRLTRSK